MYIQLNHFAVHLKLTQHCKSAMCVRVCACSVVSDSAMPRTVACQAPLSMGFSRQEYCSGLSCPSPGDLPDPGVELAFCELQADSLQLSGVAPLFLINSINLKLEIFSKMLSKGLEIQSASEKYYYVIGNDIHR